MPVLFILQLGLTILLFGVLFYKVSVYPFYCYDCYLLCCLAWIYTVLANNTTNIPLMQQIYLLLSDCSSSDHCDETVPKCHVIQNWKYKLQLV